MKINIDIESKMKMDIVGYYWTEEEVNKIVEVLVEYQDLFPQNMMELRGMNKEIGTIEIQLKIDYKP